jgi:hypothetical protein
VETLDDQTPGVREAAAASLKTLTGVDFEQDKEKWAMWWQEQLKALKAGSDKKNIEE